MTWIVFGKTNTYIVKNNIIVQAQILRVSDLFKDQQTNGLPDYGQSEL